MASLLALLLLPRLLVLVAQAPLAVRLHAVRKSLAIECASYLPLHDTRVSRPGLQLKPQFRYWQLRDSLWRGVETIHAPTLSGTACLGAHLQAIRLGRVSIEFAVVLVGGAPAAQLHLHWGVPPLSQLLPSVLVLRSRIAHSLPDDASEAT